VELRHLRYFEALARTLSFSNAAIKVHVAQSTMSHQIRQLEEELGQPLFIRDGRSVTLTEAGEVLLSEVEQTLRQVDHLKRLFDRSGQLVSGLLRVGATQSFAGQVIPECIDHFMRRFPSMRIVVEELSNETIIECISAGSLDIGIGYRPYAPSNIWFKPLYNEELMLLVQSNHPFARRRRIQMSELHHLRMVMLPSTFSTRKILDEHLKAADAEPIIIVEMNSLVPMVELVRRTDLAALVAYGVVRDHKNLCIIPVENPTPIRIPGLMLRKTGKRDAATQAFSIIVRRVIEQLDLHRLGRPKRKDLRWKPAAKASGGK
jgi:LysR family transcriptional regulator, cyn operon transcriptional activator